MARKTDSLNREPIAIAAPVPPPPSSGQQCIGDVAFLIDDSGSIRDNSTPMNDNWKKLVDFVRQLIQRFDDVSSATTRVAIAKFSTNAEVVHRLTDPQSKQSLATALNQMVYTAGITNTVRGVDLVRQEFFTGSTATGDRPGLNNVMILITDGKPTDINQQTEQLLRRLNDFRLTSRLILIGVTSEVDEAFLARMEPNPANRFYVGQFNMLGNVLDAVKLSLCNALRR